MNGRVLLVLVATCPLLTWAADDIKPLNVKLGLWESSTTSQTSGMPPIPDEVLSKLTPEQRAKIEAAAKARQAKGPQTQTRKSCLTKEQLEKMMAFGNDNNPGCTRTVVRSTSSVQDIRFDCPNAPMGMKGGGEIHVEAVSPEEVKGTTQMNAAGGSNNMTMKVSFTAHWLGADCGSVK